MSDESVIRSTVEAELYEHGFCAVNTNGVSMRPLLRPGCAVNIKRIDRAVKKYDVVLYKLSTGRYILHRVIGKKGDILVIRGDNTYVKELVPKAAVLGYMISYIKRDRVKPASGFCYGLYSRFWNLIYPFRRVVRKIRSTIKRKA